MNYYRIFGFSKASAKFLWGILAGLLLGAVGCLFGFREKAESDRFLVLLIILFGLLTAAAVVGLILGMTGWLRKDESTQLGKRCSGGHALLLCLCAASLFFFIGELIEFQSAPASEPPEENKDAPAARASYP